MKEKAVFHFVGEAFETQAQFLRFADLFIFNLFWGEVKLIFSPQHMVKILGAWVTGTGQWAVETQPLQGGCG